jgi:hypothetical protein
LTLFVLVWAQGHPENIPKLELNFVQREKQSASERTESETRDGGSSRCFDPSASAPLSHPSAFPLPSSQGIRSRKGEKPGLFLALLLYQALLPFFLVVFSWLFFSVCFESWASPSITIPFVPIADDSVQSKREGSDFNQWFFVPFNVVRINDKKKGNRVF